MLLLYIYCAFSTVDSIPACDNMNSIFYHLFTIVYVYYTIILPCWNIVYRCIQGHSIFYHIYTMCSYVCWHMCSVWYFLACLYHVISHMLLCAVLFTRIILCNTHMSCVIRTSCIIVVIFITIIPFSKHCVTWHQCFMYKRCIFYNVCS